MDNTRLKTFQVVSDLLSFRKASQVLHLTQPAVTAQIKTLEESLGVVLLHRNGRSVALTPAGETLLNYARRIEELRNQAVAALAEYGSQEQSEIGIGASHAVAVGLLPKVLAGVLKTWPKVRTNLFIGSSREVMQALATEKLHLGIVEGDSSYPGLSVETFAQNELVPIVSSSHAWAERETVADSELIEQPLILAEQGSAARTAVENHLKRNGVLSQIHSVADVNSGEALIAAVESGIGVGFAPRLVLDRLPLTGGVKEISLENGQIFQPLSVVRRRGPNPHGPISEIISQLRKGFPGEPAQTAPAPINGRVDRERPHPITVAG